MFRKIQVCLVLLLLIAVIKIYDKNYNVVGYIEKNKVYDKSWKLKGYINPDRNKFYDKDWNYRSSIGYGTHEIFKKKKAK